MSWTRRPCFRSRFSGIVLAFGLVAELILCAAHTALTGLPASPSCRITALMRRDGFEVNGKRVARIRREEGIKVSKKQRRMKRLGISTAQRQQAERPCQVWSWDFVANQTENGSRFRILTLLRGFREPTNSRATG